MKQSPAERVERVAQAVEQLCDLHKRMLLAVQQQRPYPVRIELGKSDLDAVLDGAVELERTKAAIEALQEPIQIQDGLPRVPTYEMTEAALTVSRQHNPPLLPSCKELWASEIIWRAMVDAMPLPQAPEVSHD